MAADVGRSVYFNSHQKNVSDGGVYRCGAGDGIFMRTANGTTWLIDGGSSGCPKRWKIQNHSFYELLWREKLDYACVSHGDQDHISGVRELLLEKKIRHLVLTAVSETERPLGNWLIWQCQMVRKSSILEKTPGGRAAAGSFGAFIPGGKQKKSLRMISPWCCG